MSAKGREERVRIGASVVAAVIALACGDAALEEPSVPEATGLTSPKAPPSARQIERALADVAVTGADVQLTGAPRQPRRPGAGLPFSRRQGNEIGIDLLDLLTPDQFSPPFVNGRGIASGDIDRDGFQDVAVATRKGVRLYHNEAGTMFRELPLSVSAIADLDVFNVILVDLDGDSWLDLFVTSYTKGNHIVLSNEGRFEDGGWSVVEGAPTGVTTAIAFGDVDEDGDLDAYAGNWYYGADLKIPPEDSTNTLLLWEDGRFRAESMDEILGETLSVLLSDFDLDGHLDLIVGNDFDPPDIYYLGDGRGHFRMIEATEGIIPFSTESTMSIDTADLDNDLDFEIYLAQIAPGAPGSGAGPRRQSSLAYCDDLNRPDELEACRAGIRRLRYFETGEAHLAEHIVRCAQEPDAEIRTQCETEMALLTAIRSRQPDQCDAMAGAPPESVERCKRFFKPSRPGTDEQYVEAIPQMRHENVLLRANAQGGYDDIARKMGLHVSAWSWNALFLDADNDEWQDVYVVNGTWLGKKDTTQKFFFHNQQGKRFIEKADAFGLQSFMVQSAYVVFDMENDGDLDLLVNGIHGPFWYYQNNEARHNSVLFEFRDAQGNSQGIGTQVRIRYGGAGEAAPEKRQIRELKLGGGYHSFNPAVVHFGLGVADRILEVDVRWSTGEETRIEGVLPANALYTITRP